MARFSCQFSKNEVYQKPLLPYLSKIYRAIIIQGLYQISPNPTPSSQYFKLIRWCTLRMLPKQLSSSPISSSNNSLASRLRWYSITSLILQQNQAAEFGCICSKSAAERAVASSTKNSSSLFCTFLLSLQWVIFIKLV